MVCFQSNIGHWSPFTGHLWSISLWQESWYLRWSWHVRVTNGHNPKRAQNQNCSQRRIKSSIQRRTFCIQKSKAFYKHWFRIYFWCSQPYIVLHQFVLVCMLKCQTSNLNGITLVFIQIVCLTTCNVIARKIYMEHSSYKLDITPLYLYKPIILGCLKSQVDRLNNHLYNIWS